MLAFAFGVTKNRTARVERLGYRITNISKAGWQKFAISDLGWDISGAGSNRRSKYSLISYDAIGLRYDSCFIYLKLHRLAATLVIYP